jgi:hypothetical protein
LEIDTMAATLALPSALRTQAERFFGQSFGQTTLELVPHLASHGFAALAGEGRIWMAPEYCRPDEPTGQRLLWHELAHLAQQARGHVPSTGSALVNDPLLEAEADHMAEAAMRGERTARWISHPVATAATRVYQPVITVRVNPAKGDLYKFKDKSGANYLWEILGDRVTRLNQTLQKQMKSKLINWVTASEKAMLWGKKGHNKMFMSLDDLVAALKGRIESRDSKATERQLALRVEKSSSIRRSLAAYIEDHLNRLHKQWMKNKDAREELDEVPGGRYSPFYSTSTLIAGIRKKGRSLSEGMEYMLGGGKAGRPVTETAAFLADYAMGVKHWCVVKDPNDQNELVSVVDDKIYPLPEADGRLDHHSVNEQNNWIKAARAANVRLGAGPSATTKVTLMVTRWMIAATAASKQSESTILCNVALALFAFWNLKQKWLQTTSEIHTFHEVMIVANGLGVPLVRATDKSEVDLAQFEYPDPSDIPG